MKKMTKMLSVSEMNVFFLEDCLEVSTNSSIRFKVLKSCKNIFSKKPRMTTLKTWQDDTIFR